MKKIILSLMLLSSAIIAASQPEPLLKKELGEKEMLNEVLSWNDNIVLFSKDSESKNVIVSCFSSTMEERWTEKIPFSGSGYSGWVGGSLFMNKESFLFFYANDGKEIIYEFNDNGLVQKLPVKLLSEIRGFGWLGYLRTDKGFEVAYTNTVENAKKRVYYVSVYSTEGKRTKQVTLDLPVLEYGTWKMGEKMGEDYCFYGISESYNNDGSRTCLIQIIGPDGKHKQEIAYSLKLDSNKFPSRPNPTSVDIIKVDFSAADNAIYLYGFYDKSNKATASGHEGIFIHKLSTDGSSKYNKQYSFDQLGIKPEASQKLIKTTNLKTGKELFLGIYEMKGNKSKPSLVIVNKETGDYIESYPGKDFLDESKMSESSTNYTVLWDARLDGTLVKVFKDGSNINWISAISGITGTVPLPELNTTRQYYVHSSPVGKSILVEYDVSVKKKPVVRFYKI